MIKYVDIAFSLFIPSTYPPTFDNMIFYYYNAGYYTVQSGSTF